jgi:DNA-binding PadR family transcriptional regulator
LRKRELKRAIIRLVRARGMHGYELRKRLGTLGEEVQLSYLYKTLGEMCGEGFLVSRLEAGAHGPKTRQYYLTARGRKELGSIFGEATEMVHDFYEDYVANLPPEFFTERFGAMLKEVCDGRESMAMIMSAHLTLLHREVLEGMARRSGAKRTYLIKPAGLEAHAEYPNLTVLDGGFDDIPLKEGCLDSLIVIDIQDAVNLKRSCREFRRVLRTGGVLFGCAPFMGVTGANDPLDVGEFMKKMKCLWGGNPYLDKETIKRSLAETFDYVDIGSMAFLTSFIAGLKPIRISASYARA